MNKHIIATALAIIASPAFAQSYDPDVGTGNLTAQVAAPEPKLYNALGAYGQAPRGRRVIVDSSSRHDGLADPDANIRFQLNRESQQGRW